MNIKINELVKEKQDLIRKLDTSYESVVEKEKDELRLGEINLELEQSNKERIETVMENIPAKVETEEITTAKQARTFRKGKREVYRLLAKDAYNLYEALVKKKREGAELERRLINKNLDKFDLQETISLVRKY